MKTELPFPRALSGVLLLCLSATTLAQQDIAGVSNTSLSAPGVDGSPATEGRAWTITPRVALTETLTDNVNINRTGNGKQSDLISELAPGIRIESRTARLKGYFDYSLHGQFYAQTDYSRTQNALNTFGTFEAVDNWLFLDFSGIIAQQSISAFGAQSPSSGSINNNSTETASYRLSPYIRGQLGGTVDYSLRHNLSTTQSDSANANDIDISQWVGQLRGNTSFQSLSWTIDGSQQTTEYSRGGKTEAETLRGFFTYSLLPQFRVSLSAGRESNNYASLDQESTNTRGYGFDWNPTERTQISAFKEKRFFGDGHNLRFNHRFPMSSISFTDTRDVSVLPNQFSTVGLGNVYDLYFEQFASLIPDPVTRAKFVNTLLAQTGMNPNTQVTGGFLSSRATVQRSQQLALALFGVRNSITLLVNRNENQSMLASNTLSDDFSHSNVVRQRGLSLNFSHRLSEISNLNILASRQESTGSGAATTKATTTTYQVNVSTKLGAKTTGSMSARRSEFDSTANPYTENALIGTVSFIY
ncbi:TIGR03016 family PEP-CTERM system-associated outer membrane protein [Dechloromonas denitrificans]|uniref:TIGR03016 family PEP-CTERM system-associated outer membrane protein n=1 Tax=Dechloromonas denitrificans TaxID=281362 RepID=UPI001CF8342F|nr:TIGR03016 family PEP-CTERM system-associated outer membrane protein [Dechloromonas denitrificans]UCV01921.1 TIGR03016 family PEP-CTERM system-associated outer membrane protein [Dechloromonas denitrificans]